VTEAIAHARTSIAEVRADPTLAAEPAAWARVVVGFATVEDELARLRALQPDLRVLASVGLQLGAFVHDINGMLGQAAVVRELIEFL
ncbi:hypothetical protein K7G98_41025, partial [Saccharothrix sp. MB29]|nr:hypothetical protein [Saccharothrix sp. MB29]